jgi:RNA polymerase sigma-70 factor, ECF subfamily
MPAAQNAPFREPASCDTLNPVSTDKLEATRTNAAWLRDLAGPGDDQAAAIGDLRALLRRAALYTLSRTGVHGASLVRGQVEEIAEECAQEALLAILDRLADFRAESKFTTWAYKFAVNIALTAARRERWKTVSLDSLLDEGETESPVWLPGVDPSAASPELTSQQTEVWALVRKIMDEALTPRQRQVLRAMVFEEVPLDEIVRHLGSNRNAVYKLVHDARRKLKAGLEARGYAVGDILDLFSAPG